MPQEEVSPYVKRRRGVRRVKLSADGQGVVSHGGRSAARAGGVQQAGGGGQRRGDRHLQEATGAAPGQVFADLAVAVADVADAIRGIGVLGDLNELFGPVASVPTAWRLLDRIDATHLSGVQQARAAVRAKAWAAGARPDLDQELRIDCDATIAMAHSGMRTAPRPGSTRSCSTRCWRSWTAPRWLSGRRWPVCCGRVITPAPTPPPTMSRCSTWRCSRCPRRPGRDPVNRRSAAADRSDSAGATHAFATARLERGVGFSFGLPVDARIQAVVDLIPDSC